MRYFVVLILLVFTHCCEATEFRKDINLFETNPNYSLVSATNAEIVTEGNLRYWKGVNPLTPSEVIYKLTTQEIMSFSAFKSNSSLTAVSMTDFLQVSVSSNNSTWKTLDFAYLAKPYKNATRDSTFGSWRQKEIYFKGYFAGAVKFMISDNLNNQYPYLSYVGNQIPEPTSLIYIFSILLFSQIRIRTNGKTN